MSTNNPIEPLISPLADGLKDKLKDPFLNAFVISSIVWNYQAFLYAFSSLSPDTKYALIERSLNIWSIAGPALLSVFYNIIFPFVFIWGYRIAARLNTKVRNAQEVENLAFITTKTHLDAANDEIKKLQDTISKKDQEIGSLKAEMNSLGQKNRIEQSKLEQRILELEKNQSAAAQVEKIINDLKIHGFLSEFEEFGQRAEDGDNQILQPTHDFSKYILSMNLVEPVQVGGLLKRYKLSPRGKSVYNRIIQMQFEEKIDSKDQDKLQT